MTLKKHIHYFLACLITVSFFSCKEIGPAINLDGNGGNVDSTGKNVLIENFTGVQCVNCPQGDTILEQLLNQYPGRVEVIDIHAGPLAQPLHSSDPDLRSPFGDQLNNYIGPFAFQPAAAIDRKLYEIAPGDFERIVGRNYWSSLTQQELDSTSHISIEIEKDFDDASRLLNVTLTVNFLTTINTDINASVALVENNITAPQLNQTTTLTNYLHNNVLRTMISPYNGVIIDGSKASGTSWTKSFSTTLSPGWNENNCRIVAFISKSTGTYDVLQVAGINAK